MFIVILTVIYAAVIDCRNVEDAELASIGSSFKLVQKWLKFY